MAVLAYSMLLTLRLFTTFAHFTLDHFYTDKLLHLHVISFHCSFCFFFSVFFDKMFTPWANLGCIVYLGPIIQNNTRWYGSY